MNGLSDGRSRRLETRHRFPVSVLNPARMSAAVADAVFELPVVKQLVQQRPATSRERDFIRPCLIPTAPHATIVQDGRLVDDQHPSPREGATLSGNQAFLVHYPPRQAVELLNPETVHSELQLHALQASNETRLNNRLGRSVVGPTRRIASATEETQ